MEHIRRFNELNKITCGIYLFDSRNLMLIQHPTGFPNHVWGIPKGRVDVGETNLYEVAKRELFEETGVDLDKFTIEKIEEFDTVKFNLSNRYLKSFFVKVREDMSDFNFYCDSMVIRGGVPAFPEVDQWKWASIDEVMSSFDNKYGSFQLNNLIKCKELIDELEN